MPVKIEVGTIMQLAKDVDRLKEIGNATRRFWPESDQEAQSMRTDLYSITRSLNTLCRRLMDVDVTVKG